MTSRRAAVSAPAERFSFLRRFLISWRPTDIGPEFPVVQALEDDISLLWLKDNSDAATLNAVLVHTLYGDDSRVRSRPAGHGELAQLSTPTSYRLRRGDRR